MIIQVALVNKMDCKHQLIDPGVFSLLLSERHLKLLLVLFVQNLRLREALIAWFMNVSLGPFLCVMGVYL